MAFVTYAPLIFFLITPPTVLYTLFHAPVYGIHSPPSSGRTLPSGVAWCLFELPNLIVPPVILILSTHTNPNPNPNPTTPVLPFVNAALLTAYILHYIHRCMIYPLFKPVQSTRASVYVTLLAGAFTTFNASLQTLTLRDTKYSPDLTPLQILALAVFLLGMSLNTTCDYQLFALRRSDTHERGRVPSGGVFDLVACPNYTGEVLEWISWAVACNTVAAWGFAVFTAGFLGARAVQRLRGYRERGVRVRVRWAIVPGLL